VNSLTLLEAANIKQCWHVNILNVRDDSALQYGMNQRFNVINMMSVATLTSGLLQWINYQVIHIESRKFCSFCEFCDATVATRFNSNKWNLSSRDISHFVYLPTFRPPVEADFPRAML